MRVMKSRKSQFALEFLMTYGWVILTTMAIIGVLAYLTLSPKDAIPNRCTFPAGFQCMGAQISSTDAQMKIKNSMGISLYSIRAVSSDNSFNCSVSPNPCPEDCTLFVICNTTGTRSGDATKLNVNLYYKKQSNGYDQVAQGEVYENIGR